MDIYHNQKGNSGLIIVLAMGWGAFIALGLYGYFIYGPQQFVEGVASGTGPVSDIGSIIPAGEILDPLGQVVQISVISVIKEIQADSILISVPDLSQPLGERDQLFSIDDNTEYIKRSVILNSFVGDDGLIQEGGELVDQVATQNDLIIGLQVEVFYSDKEPNNPSATKIVIIQ